MQVVEKLHLDKCRPSEPLQVPSLTHTSLPHLEGGALIKLPAAYEDGEWSFLGRNKEVNGLLLVASC